ncbi:DUF2312 domain-containing protein [Chelativorans sp. AA-79]|nr:GapR family DNA-binding domain-containing protein [Chelativorans sp. AA-79]WEX10335.1 DUF2312 domain-containing protein [Chelativorans sp. AA-79]
MSDTVGHNTFAAGQLRAFIERIERLEEEKKNISDDIKDVYAEMKGNGFDTKAVRTIIKLRKKDQAERQEEEAILHTYMHALGMIQMDMFRDARGAVPLDREARAKRRTSEAMDDNKAFSAELLANGLITEEAHAENLRLSDAVALKIGAGVIDPETGEIIESAKPKMDRAGGTTAQPNNPVAAENAPKAIPVKPEAGSVSHAGAGESPAANSNPSASSSPQAVDAGEGVPPPTSSPDPIQPDPLAAGADDGQPSEPTPNAGRAKMEQRANATPGRVGEAPSAKQAKSGEAVTVSTADIDLDIPASLDRRGELRREKSDA